MQPVKVYCTSCWTDRNITHNGKCPACGTQFPRPAHWNKTMTKLKLIIQNNDMIGIEIKGLLYFITPELVQRYKTMNLHDFREVGNFMHDIKEKCESHKV